MTREEREKAIKELQQIVESAEWVDSSTADCVSIDLIKCAVQALQMEPCVDAISKSAVREHISNRLYESALNNTDYMCKASEVFADIAEHRLDIWLNELPSVQPQTDLARDINVTTTDAISRKHFDERVRLAGGMAGEELTQDFKDGVLTVLEMLKTEPSVQPQKVGKWINKGFGYAECPFCGFGEGGAFVFKCCPSCCAKMEEGEENSSAYITNQKEMV